VGNVAYTAPAGVTGAASAVLSNLAVQTAVSRYSFRVVPVRGTTMGPAGNIAAVTLTGAPSTITGLSVVPSTAGQALVSWTDTANNNVSTTVQQRSTGSVARITLASGGSGYLTAPTVTLSAPAAGGVQAVANAVITGGVVSIVVTNPGSGYLTAPTVRITGGSRSAGGRVASGTGTAVSSITGGLWTSGWVNSSTTPTPVNGLLASVTISGLTVGTAYQFQVMPVGITGTTGALTTNGAGVIIAK
jgi:hypothetical protein